MSAVTTISNPNYKYKVKIKDGDTEDIAKVLIQVIKSDIDQQTKAFSKNFSRDIPSMRRLWHFVKYDIPYQRDPLGKQWIQTPSRLWNKGKGKGDCKSKTAFIVSVLRNLGFKLGQDIIIRFSSFHKVKDHKKRKSYMLTHVYPLVQLNGQWIIMDTVWHTFNAEKDYTFKFDYPMNGVEIAILSGTANPNEFAHAIKVDRERFDITKATRGETRLFLLRDRLLMDSAIAKTKTDRQKYFNAAVKVHQAKLQLRQPKKEVLERIKLDCSCISGIGTTIANEIERAQSLTQPEIGKIGDRLRQLKQRILNSVFKLLLPKAAPYFIYSVTTLSLPPAAKVKKAKQDKVKAWIIRASGMKATTFNQTVNNGLKRKFGKTADQIIKGWQSGISGYGIGAVTAAAITGVIGTVIDLISKLFSIFKKDKPSVSKSDAASPDDFKGSNRGSQTNNHKPNIHPQQPKQQHPSKDVIIRHDDYLDQKVEKEKGNNTGLLLLIAFIFLNKKKPKG
jgi:hypothetical protein